MILHYGGMFLKSVFCGVLTNTPLVSPLHFSFSFVSNRTITSNQAREIWPRLFETVKMVKNVNCLRLTLVTSQNYDGGSNHNTFSGMKSVVILRMVTSHAWCRCARSTSPTRTIGSARTTLTIIIRINNYSAFSLRLNLQLGKSEFKTVSFSSRVSSFFECNHHVTLLFFPSHSSTIIIVTFLKCT